MPIFQIRVERSAFDEVFEPAPPPVEAPKSTHEQTVEIEAGSMEEAKSIALAEVRKLVSRGRLEVLSAVEKTQKDEEGIPKSDVPVNI